MGASNIAVNKKGQSVPRSGFVYDVLLRGLDPSFWKTLTNTVSAASNKIRLASGGAIASYTQFKYGVFRFALNVPTTPSAGEAKKWGLLLPGAPTIGSMFFEIAGATFRAVSYDENGNAQTTNCTWSGDGAETVFEIEWEEDLINFKVGGVVVATHQTRVGSVSLPIYLINSDADNTDLGYVAIKEVGQYSDIAGLNTAPSSSGSSSSSSSSSAGGGGASTYSNAQGDFVATANVGAKTITLSAYANAVLSAVISSTNFLTATIKRRTSAGVVDSLPVTNVSFAANVLTLSDMAANFAAGDTVEVVIVGPDKAFVAAVNATLTKSYDAPHYEYQDPTYGFAGTQDKLPAGDILGEILVRQQALTNSFKVKDSAGRLKLAFGHIDPALGSGTYYVCAIDSVTDPVNGAVTHVVDPQILNHTNNVGRPWALDLRGASFKFTNGCWIVLSSTYPLLTKAGSYMSGDASAA